MKIANANLARRRPTIIEVRRVQSHTGSDAVETFLAALGISIEAEGFAPLRPDESVGSFASRFVTYLKHMKASDKDIDRALQIGQVALDALPGFEAEIAIQKEAWDFFGPPESDSGSTSESSTAEESR